MKQKTDYAFLALAAGLTAAGLVFLAMLTAPISLEYFGNTTYYLFHQSFALALGLVLAVIAFRVPLGWVKKIALPLFVLNVAALVIVFLPAVGLKFWGAKRWISLGSNTIQPSEFLKVTAVIYLSAWLSNRTMAAAKRGAIQAAKRSLNLLKTVFLPFMLLLTVIGLLMLLQRDMSTLGIITLSLLVVYFLADTPGWHTLLCLGSGVLAATLLVVVEPYRLQRFLVFLHPNADPLGSGFQLRQALLAVGSGGIFGKGLGMSTQKFGYLPQAMSDSVFAVLGEETGLIGCLVVIALFVLLFWRILNISRNANDRFSVLTAAGLGTWIIVQTFINIGSSIGVFPLSGVPLPFFSYGGSHLIAELAAMGLLANISKNG